MPTKTKQSESKNIPKLRFLDFSGEWNSGRMEDVAKINQGLQIPISERHAKKVENSYFYITNEFLKENSKKEYFIKNPPKSVLCNEDDILMTRTGNTGHVVTNVSGAFHNNFFKIKYDKKKIDKNFLYHFLVLPKTNNFILRLAGNSTIPDLNHGDFYKIKINFPSLPEQQKIAKFLGSVDKWVENLRAQKQSFEEYKKGMMQKIFSQEVRFRDDNGKYFTEWEEKRLGEITTLITKGTTPTSIDFKFEKEGVNFIKVENIDSNSNIKITGTPKISEECNEALKRSRLQENDIVFSIAGTLGRTAIVGKKDLPANTNQALSLIRLKDGCSVNFINAYLSLRRIKKYIHRMLSVGAQPNLSLQQVGDIFLNLPSLPEQQKIADFLTKLDNLIGSKQQQITQAETWKKGLMQGLFV